MFEGEGSEAGSVNTLERGPNGLPPARTEEEWAGSVLRDWRGRVSELGGEALSAFWAEAARYARREIGRYGRWQEQDEPVLAGGYDAEGGGASGL